MYLINIKKLKDEEILNNIYQSIEHFRLQDRVFITYEIDIENRDIELFNVQTHAFILDLNELSKISESDMEELVYDLIETRSNVLVRHDTGKDNDILKRFEGICLKNGLAYMELKKFDFNKDIKLEDLQYNEYQIVKEIFEETVEVRSFRSTDFMIKLEIDSKGKIYDRKGKFVLDLASSEFISILNMAKEENVLNKEMNFFREAKGLFTLDFYDPFVFMFDVEEINQKIIDYKYKVFDLIKDLSPEDYPRVPRPIIDILNKNEFIRLTDILNIIKVDHEVKEDAGC
ncbi:hypothetical protein [Wukongibacter baidiensis]